MSLTLSRDTVCCSCLSSSRIAAQKPVEDVWLPPRQPHTNTNMLIGQCMGTTAWISRTQFVFVRSILMSSFGGWQRIGSDVDIELFDVDHPCQPQSWIQPFAQNRCSSLLTAHPQNGAVIALHPANKFTISWSMECQCGHCGCEGVFLHRISSSIQLRLILIHCTDPSHNDAVRGWEFGIWGSHQHTPTQLKEIPLGVSLWKRISWGSRGAPWLELVATSTIPAQDSR